jgi:hypothetical protein
MLAFAGLPTFIGGYSAWSLVGSGDLPPSQTLVMEQGDFGVSVSLITPTQDGDRVYSLRLAKTGKVYIPSFTTQLVD